MDSKVVDKDGFVHVSYKGKKNRHLKPPDCSLSVTKHVPDSLQNFEAVISDIQKELKDFIINFKEEFLEVLIEWDLAYLVTVEEEDLQIFRDCDLLKGVEQDIDIVCYGLGQFSSCTTARYQLGFLLLLKNILHSTNIYIYDPQFSVEEVSFLKDLGMNVLNINEEGKRQVKRKTVCFMPHCDLPLYNNLLWANWSKKNLSELVIIGNSFENYQFYDAKCTLKERAKYVYLANNFVTEVPVANDFRISDIFNDLSIHYFKLNSVGIVDPVYWTDLDEPKYSDDDGIIKKS